MKLNKFCEKSLALSVSLATLTLVSGCGSSSNSEAGASTGAGSLSLSVTDSPIDGADNVFVEFTAIELKPASGSSQTITLDTPQTIDLLAQQGGNSALLLSDENIPSGDYNWIRLAVNAESDGDPQNDSYIVISGTPYELTVPSGSQSGLKLNSGFTIPDGGSANFTIDFDLRHSIVEANGEYKLKPVLRLVDNAGAATISGTIDLAVVTGACSNVDAFAGAVYIFTGHDITPDDIDINSPNPIATATAKPNADATAYEYTAAFLLAGNYTVAYTCGSDGAESDDAITFYATKYNVTLGENELETVNF